MPGLGFICFGNVNIAAYFRCEKQYRSLHRYLAHLPLATGQGDVDESSGVLVALESTTLGGLGLLLRLNLWNDGGQ